MRVEFQKPLYDKDNRWVGREPAYGTILHWGVASEEHNRGDGANIALVYTVVFVSEESTGSVFEINPLHIKIIC